MALTKKVIQYGIEQIYIGPITKDDETGTEYGPSLEWMEGAQNLKVTETITTSTLTGDNGTKGTRSRTENFAVEMGFGIITYDILKILKGGEVIEIKDAGGTEVIQRKWVQKNDSEGQEFGLIGVTGDGQKVILAKVKASEVEVQYQSSNFAAVSFKAIAYARKSDGVMRVFDHAQTETAPSLTDFDIA